MPAMTAVVTDVHYRMSLALIRDLAQAGVQVVACEGERCRGNPASPALGAMSRYTGRHCWLPEGNRLDALLSLCREVGEETGCRPALLPVGAGTLSLLAANREAADGVCGLCIPSLPQLERMNSKEQSAALARKLGIPVPEAFSRREGESVAGFARRLPLPCVVKPVCGEKLGLAAAGRYVIARTAEEAETAYAHFSDLAGEPPVVQEWLPGGGWGCSVLAEGGRVLASICHRRLREFPVSGGPSSCCVCREDPQLRAWAEAVAAETGYTGLAMLEFKEGPDGHPRFLEVNPRVWGTFPLTRVSGSGIPYLWFLSAWNAGNPDLAVPIPRTPRPKGKKMIFAASDLMAGVGYAKRGEIGRLFQAAGDFLNPAVRDGLFEWGDPLPGLAYLRSLLAKERRP